MIFKSIIYALLIAVLLGVWLLLPQRLGPSRPSKYVVAKTHLTSISNALRYYHRHNDHYPLELEALLSRPDGATNWGGPYLQEDAPLVDPWGRAYVYTPAKPDHAFDFVLFSNGPDGRPNTPDDLLAARPSDLTNTFVGIPKRYTWWSR